MTDSIITGASFIPITPITPVLSTASVITGPNADASVIRAKAEQEVAALRAALRADVAKVEADAASFWTKVKAAAGKYGPSFLIGWALGFVAGVGVRHFV